MAISTQGTKLKITKGETAVTTLNIKSFPDLGAAPATIDVTTLADDVQKFIPGVKGMAAMEFVANYDEAEFTKLAAEEGVELKYTLNFGTKEYSFMGQHNVLVVGAGVNAALDMKVVVVPASEITSGNVQ